MSQSYKVWSKFSSKRADGEILNFRLVDMPNDRFKDVFDLLLKYFVPEEAVFRASGIPESVNAMEEVKLFLSLWKTKSLHIIVCCIDYGTENIHDIIGASFLGVRSKDDLFIEIQPQTKEMKKYIEITCGLYSKFDISKAFGLNIVYRDWGVVVHPKYRSLGIAQEFFRVRRMLCKEHGVPMTGAWMMSLGTQKAAERDGWEIAYENTFKDLGEQCAVTFKDTPPTYKYMIVRNKIQ